MCGQDKLYLFARVYLVTVFLIAQSSAQDFTSHIHSTNQHINQLLFYRPYTQPAMIKNRNSINIDIAQSNIFQKSENMEADLEITTFETTFYYIYSSILEFSFNYPFYNVSAGFMDDGLDLVHKTLGIATTREHEGHINNKINFYIAGRVDKSTAYLVSGNPQIELKYSLYRENNLFISTIWGVKIPIGKSENGFSSEKVDIMTTIALQKNYDEISWLVNIAVTLNGNYNITSDINSEKIRYFLTVANQFPLDYLIPFKFTNSSSFLFNYKYSSAPYKSSDEKFGSYSNLFQFAIRTELKNQEYIDLFFNQNTIPRDNEADVTFGFSYHFKGL